MWLPTRQFSSLVLGGASRAYRGSSSSSRRRLSEGEALVRQEAGSDSDRERFVVDVLRNHIGNTGNAITAVRRRSTYASGLSRFSTYRGH